MATGLRAGNLMALMFPAVMLVMNVSSVAVIWFGAFQVQNAGVEIGTLFAFLNYMMQILMGVMMATFMFVMIPRAAVCANRIGEVLDTDPSVVGAGRPRSTRPRPAGRIEFDHVDFAYPGAEEAVLHDITFTVEPGTTTAIIGSTGAGKTTLIGLVARLFDVTAGSVRVDDVDVRDVRSRRAVGARRTRPAARVPLLGHDRVEPALRRHGGDRRRALARARARPGEGLRRGDARAARGADRPGRHERLGRPATATRDRPRHREAPGGLHLRRLVLGAGSENGCRAQTRARHAPARRHASGRRAARLDDPARRPDRRARPRTDGRASAPTTNSSRRARRIARSSIRSSRWRRRHERLAAVPAGSGAGPSRSDGRRPDGSRRHGRAGPEGAELRTEREAAARHAPHRHAAADRRARVQRPERRPLGDRPEAPRQRARTWCSRASSRCRCRRA